MWAFFQGIWAQSILDIHANANQAYGAGASYFRLVWLWWCLISKIFNAERWCELPKVRSNLFLEDCHHAHTISPMLATPPFCVLLSCLVVIWKIGNWLVVTLNVEASKKLVEGLVILETSRATTKCLWRLCHQHTRKLNLSTGIFSLKNWWLKLYWSCSL